MIVLPVVLLIGSLALAQTNETSTTNSASAADAQPIEIVDPGKICNDKNMTDWVGKSVVLKNVMVQDTNKTGNFWVGSDNGHRLLVVEAENNPNLSTMKFHKGDVVTIHGVVQAASKYMAQKTSASSGSMHDATDSSGVFLAADNISVTSSTQR